MIKFPEGDCLSLTTRLILKQLARYKSVLTKIGVKLLSFITNYNTNVTALLNSCVELKLFRQGYTLVRIFYLSRVIKIANKIFIFNE